MATPQIHEPLDKLSAQTLEMHRALASLIEELEAVDWYAQRVDASDDEALREILAHNRDEEKEHACMTLEWIRRRDPGFDAYLRKFLFKTGPVVGREHGGAASEPSAGGHGASSEPTLGIGSLRAQEATS